MNVVAVTMVRDEADIVMSTVAHMLTQVDAVIVADNLSVDDTRLLLDRYAEHEDRLLVVDDFDPAYRQSEKMTGLAHRAFDEFDADWIVPFDADEWWYSTFHPRLADALAEIPDKFDLVPADLYDHVPTGHDGDLDGDPVSRIGWRRREKLPLPKVACRYRPNLVIEQGNHKAHYTGEKWKPWHEPALVVRHFPYRSVDQLVRKVRNGAAAYRAAGDSVAPSYGGHWRQWGEWLEQADGEDKLGDVFRRWYWSADPVNDPTLIYDPAP